MRLFDYIVWYKDARPWYPRWWLCLAYDNSRYYDAERRKAIRFSTKKDAIASIPIYDGSGRIERRTGVKRVLRKWWPG